MRFRFHRSRRFGPFRLHVDERGVAWGVSIWRWSWNSRTRRHYVDTPGPGYVELGRGRRRR
jgi:hypothetical protein